MRPRIAWCLIYGVGCANALAQSVPPQTPQPRVVCPGDPAGNLSSKDCSFTMSLRLESFVTGSLTDQAMLGATFFGAVAQVRNDPPEWGRNWTAYGYRVGSRYGQDVGKGVVEFVFGEAMRTDPRHISYASDPRVTKLPTTSRRIGHAFMDFLTVRQSSAAGDGKALPNIPVFAGAAGSAFVGNLWYPESAKAPGQVALRAGGCLATALGGSFYTEFSPELGRLLGGIFKRGRTPATKAPAAKGASD